MPSMTIVEGLLRILLGCNVVLTTNCDLQVANCNGRLDN
jgi:hypothetical protein